MRARQLWILVTFLILLGLVFLSLDRSATRLRGTRPVDMPQLVALVEGGRVDAIVVRGQRIKATLDDGTAVTTLGPERSDVYLQLFDEYGIIPSFQRTEEHWIQIAGALFPALLLVGVILVALGRVPAVSTRRGIFGRLRFRPGPATRRLTLADVAGATATKLELAELVGFLREPNRFARVGGRIPRGVLLVGPPGVGKALMARAVAGEAGVPWSHLSSAGASARDVLDLGRRPNRRGPCVVYVDDVDILNRLPAELDALPGDDGLLVIGATHQPERLSAAVFRSGRIGRTITIPLPDQAERLAILSFYATRCPLAADADLAEIAVGTSGLTGAQLENLVNEAALSAGRRDEAEVAQVDLVAARARIVASPSSAGG
ncbi:MAG: AAA family ATPase [Myxococcales bacterium]|nr:AAA family ATPase [Myxococcales bacterium]